MKFWILLVVSVALGACAETGTGLKVKRFYLRDQDDSNSDDPMLRGEKLRLLHGATSMEERRARLGQYYTVLWEDESGAGSGEVEVRFEYQQGGSASLVKTRTERFPAGDTSGKAVFSVIGDDYFKRGKVLTWKVTLWRGGREIASEQSYLWR